MKQRKSYLRGLRMLFMVVMAVMLASSCAFQGFAKRQTKKAIANGPYDAIIVPGVPYYDSTINKVQLQRVTWAKYVYDKGWAKNIIFSGAAVYTPYCEGKIMKAYADSMGVPAGHTFAETCAEHSVENIWYGIKMARRLGFKKVAVVSDPFQTKLLMGFIKKRCNGLAVIPITYKQLKALNQQVPNINPAGARKTEGFVALPDRQTRGERWKGTMGKYINFSDTTDAAPCPQ